MFKKLKTVINEAKIHYGIGLDIAFSEFTNSFNSLFVDREFFDDDFFEELEEKLIELEITPNLAITLAGEIEKKIYNQRVNKEEFEDALYNTIIEVVDFKEDNSLTVSDDRLNVFLVVGINGVGKTTTISKLANKYKNKNIELVAADTFRAGAIDQLSLWSERLNIPIVKTHQGHAPSAVIYEGMNSAKNNNREILICDTAGRLHNKNELMQELKKIHGVIDKQVNQENINLKTILVLDGTAGKNTIEQARAFNEITNLDGVIVTKMDTNAKIGSIINITYEINKPIYYLTNGEQVEDIKEFDPKTYLSLLFSKDDK